MPDAVTDTASIGLAHGWYALSLPRLEDPTDRRGIDTTVTVAGLAPLAEARPTHDAALRKALDAAGADPRPAPLVETMEQLSRTAAG